jgi:hypothetical protein
VARFVRESGLYEVQVTLETPFPGTPLYTRLAAEGRLLQPGAWEKCTLFDVAFQPQALPADELRQRFHALVGELYAPEAIHRRRAAFARQRRVAAMN